MQRYLNAWRGESWFLRCSLKCSAGYFRWEAGLHVFHSPAAYALLTGPPYGRFGGRGWKVGSLRVHPRLLWESPGLSSPAVGLWDRAPFSSSACAPCCLLPVLFTALGTGCGVTVLSLWAPHVKLSRLGLTVH